VVNDPIVLEARKAGQALEDQAGGNVHKFFEHLRDAQKQYPKRVVRVPGQSIPAMSERTQ
jgi:hypothetical protein